MLLSQYLREHHQLRLPGLGSFYASGLPATGDAETQTAIDVRFERGTVKEADDQFLDFIKQKTGKIKPLAVADLDSYIESGMQLLNIGKPFYIEGIGTILKTREGKYEFVARELAAREESNGHAADRTERSAYAEKVRPVEKKKSVFDDEKYTPSTNPWQKLVVAALILGGLAVVVLGGYYLYMQKNDKAEIQQQAIPVVTDSTSNQDTLSAPRIDTSQSMASYAAVQNGSYKFVLETTTSKKRALRRFEQLKSYMLPIKLESPDSVNYKLYFLIPSTPADTLRIKDSLSRYYLSKVKIEM